MSSSLTKPSSPTGSPAPNPNISQIPAPIANVGALAYVAESLKQAVDSLAGFRGNATDRAVTFNDLVNLGLASTTVVASATGTVAPSPTVTPYVLSGFAPSVMSANQVIFGHEFSVAVTFQVGFGSIAPGVFSSDVGAFVAATGTPVFNIQKCPAASDPTVSGSWSTVGTATFSAPHTATLFSAAGVVFNAGDFLRIVAPASPDPTLSQLFLCLVGKR